MNKYGRVIFLIFALGLLTLAVIQLSQYGTGILSTVKRSV